jgi:putative membrane protein
MLRLLTTTAIGVGLLVASTSFAQTSHPNPAAGPAPTTVPGNRLDQQDASFIKEAAGGGMAEVTLSKMAEKSTNPDVKRFAEKMVRDHTAANTELTAIATGLGAEMPKTLDTDHQKIHDQLEGMHGKPFDQQYMRVMVEDHDQAVKLFRQQANSGHDLRLKQFAQKTLPTIEEHQKMALDLSRRLSETAAR